MGRGDRGKKEVSQIIENLYILNGGQIDAQALLRRTSFTFPRRKR